MGRKSKEQLAEEAANKEAVGKGLISQPGTSVVEYYDPGTHWCKSCNFVAFKLYGYLEHLQTSSHMKVWLWCGVFVCLYFNNIQINYI